MQTSTLSPIQFSRGLFETILGLFKIKIIVEDLTLDNQKVDMWILIKQAIYVNKHYSHQVV